MVRHIEGTIDYEKRNEVLNDNHKILIYLDDMTLTEIAAQDGSYIRKFHTISKLILENQIRTFPITFDMEYDEKDIEKTSNYSLRVRIVADGKTRFITSSSVPVLTKGHGDMVDIMVEKIDLM
ncbi:unnamed protein product [Rotaria magnacalcarata]|uniref:Uncharacterized protein n=3 Tax=Rotaria magnacalcarata TaxID=392030 RepID=A0A816ZAI0_9BILA|nr:unnamed protein product [Rotaria magnacalcarata]CAF1622407.1 unnamed protein product [Rotaria magnacalcarata]CAF2048783.1 unnamed protein product [Rotaria magnacalcarata]CAF2163750.1 unnamed protein product [Rotaria magnacalcarata]CAF2193570.1 unnamed protein product [Rotaria magnacalcarata]